MLFALQLHSNGIERKQIYEGSKPMNFLYPTAASTGA